MVWFPPAAGERGSLAEMVCRNYAHGQRCMMAGKRGTAQDVEKRRQVIEAALMGGGWSLQVQAQLATRYSISTAQVRKDAALIRRQWAARNPMLKKEPPR